MQDVHNPEPRGLHGGTDAQRATVSGPGLSWPLHSILDYPSTGRGPLPDPGGSRKVTKTFQISGCTQNPYLTNYPKIFQNTRKEVRLDFIPGRGQISVRQTLGLRKLPQSFWSLQRTRIRDDACFPRLCQTPPGGPDQVLITPRPSRGVVSCVALGLPGHPRKGGVPRYPPMGVFREWSRPVLGSCLPCQGVSPTYPPPQGSRLAGLGVVSRHPSL